MFPQDPRRRRRRRRYLVPLAVTALLLIAWGATSLRSDDRTRAGFFDALVQHAETQSATAVGFQQLLATLSSVDRDLVSDRIAELREELTASTEQLDQEEVPEGAEAASALFDLALEEWDAGLAAFDTSLLAVADDPESEEAVEGLAGSIQRIAVGDLLYRRFLEESEGLRSNLDVAIASTYPEVSFIPERFAGTSAAASIAGTVRANPSLDLNPDIDINQVSFEPEAVLNTDDQLVVTATDEVTVSVVVANVGNVPRRGGQLRVRLEDGDGDVAENMSAEYPELDARASTSVTFDPMPVEPGTGYVLVITLVAGDGEQNLENNVEEVPFSVNAAG